MCSYQDSELLSQSGRHKSKNKTTNSDTCPETSSNHTRLEITTASLPAHKSNDPPSECDFGANVTQKEDRRNPCDTTFQCFLETAFASRMRAWIIFTVFLA